MRAALSRSKRKDESRWCVVPATEARISQVWAPCAVRLPQESLRAMTAGRSYLSVRRTADV